MRVPRPFVVLLCLSCLPAFAQRKMPVRAKNVSAKQLPQHYREWIEEDVPYIISEDEKNEFLRL